MLKTKTLLALCFTAGATAASAQEACTSYSVQPGDSLSAIARTAYGSTSFQALWDANRTTIGSDPNTISVGTKLNLPCADGSLPTTAAAPAPAPAPAPSAPTDSEPVSIRLVTASGYAPFTDESMEGGGIYTQLVRAAMDTMEPEVETSITFVNDWGSHLDALLPSTAYDGAFPWLRPNCEAPDTLTENSLFRCEEFIHSDPFYEVINSLTVNENSELATTDDYADFEGTTICLPDGYTDAVLAAGGLVEPFITLSQPVDPDDCIRQLDAGEVDAASLEQRQVEDIIQRLGLEGKFVSNPNLTEVSTLSVFISKKNPDGPEVIELLNEGLKNIRDNGVWFQTVRAGFTAFYDQ